MLPPRVMLDPEALRRALSIHKKTYALLRWTANALDRGALDFDTVHHDMGREEAAVAWLRQHHQDLPLEARPDLDDLDAFARFFLAYLETSFTLVEFPGKRWSAPGGCHCDLCVTLVDIPRLRPKKLAPGDKAHARRREVAMLAALAEAHGCAPPRDTVVHDPALREDLALVAWAMDLFDRLAGTHGGPETLALWRTFAWKPEGSPKPGFQVSVEMIVEAEGRLVARLQEAG